jgi:hypothetical protein
MAYNLQGMKTNINKYYKVNVRGGGRTKALLLESSFLETQKFFDNKFKK